MSAVLTEQPQSMGSKIDELYELRERKRELNKQLKDIEETMKAVEASIIEDLDKQDLKFSGGSKARATVTESTVPTAEDWEPIERYVLENEATYLFERRIAAGPWRELLESGVLVPGTKPYVKRGLSLRKL